jgi:hypothetical protein
MRIGAYRLSAISLAFNPELCGPVKGLFRKAVPETIEETKLGQVCNHVEEDDEYYEDGEYYADEL